jgi:hypothetical protein
MAKKDINKKENTYLGVEVREGNIRVFHNLFMEHMAESWEFDLEKEVLRQKGELTEEHERRIEKESKPIKKKISNLYKILCILRLSIKEKYDMSEAYRNQMDEMCKDDFEIWINHFGWTDDSRLVVFGLQSLVPFIMTQQQSTALRKIDKCIKNRRNVLIQKSRAEGITELLAHYDIWCWLYKPGYKGGWGSRKQDLVDKRGSPGSIFSRLRRIIYKLPKAMLPKPFHKDNNPYDKILTIHNPNMNTYLIGEGGDNIGRGDKYTTVKVDEKAFVEHPESVDEALSNTCDCQIDISTPNGQDHFFRKSVSGKVEVITLWWYKNPSKNKNWRTGERPPSGECGWYEYQKLRHDSVVVAKEIDIDFFASVSGSMIEPDWVKAATDLKLNAGGIKVGGLDIAAGGKDSTVYVGREGPIAGAPQILPFTSPSKSAWAASEICEEDGAQILVYDQNTLGEDVYTILKEGDRKVKFELIGVYGQARASDRLYDEQGLKGFEKFRNLRAEIWWSLRKRFEKTYLHVTGAATFPEDELISISSKDDGLLNELSSPRLMFMPNGKIGVESKREMASRNVSSPDKADALAYCFYPLNNTNAVIPHFKNTNSENYKNFQLSPYMPIDIYVSVFHTPDMNVYMNVCGLDLNTKKLLVIAEYRYDIFDAGLIARNALQSARRFPIVKWIGNNEIFDGLQKGKNVIWYEYRKARIKLTQNYRDDMKMSIDTIDRMFKDNYLCLHEDCELTMQHVRNWKHKSGRPDTNLYFAMCLSQVITTLKRKKMVYNSPVDEYSGYNVV